MVQALLFAVMASLAETLQVGLIPELGLTAAMWLAVIADQLGRVRLKQSAHLTGEQIADEYLHAKLLPPGNAIPPTPWLYLHAVRVSALLATRCRTKARLHGRDQRLDQFELRSSHQKVIPSVHRLTAVKIAFCSALVGSRPMNSVAQA